MRIQNMVHVVRTNESGSARDEKSHSEMILHHREGV